MKLENLSVSYGEKTIIHSLTAELPPPVTCIMGESGCGKTTLLTVIAGLMRPSSGKIIGGPSRPSVMFQEDRLFPWYTALQNITIVCEDENRARKLLEAVELSEAADLPINQLSGGMRRRVALARALSYDGDMLILDEPFQGMDKALTERMAFLVRKSTVPVIVSTHSLYEAELLGGNILYLKRERRKVPGGCEENHLVTDSNR